MGLDIKFPESLKLTNYAVPGRFARYNTPSSFLVNFWSSGLTLLGLLLILLVLYICGHFTPKNYRLHQFLRRMIQALRWNICLAVFIPLYKSIIVFTSLEMRTAHLNAFLPVFSFMLCIAMNFLAGVVIVKIVKVVKILRSLGHQHFSKSTNSQEDNMVEEKTLRTLRDYEIVYKSYKEETIPQQVFLLFLIVRMYAFYIIIGYLFDYPIAQTILIFVINIITTTYLSVTKPHKDRMELVLCLTEEVILFVINTCVFILSVLDRLGLKASESRENLGKTVIAMNFALLSIGCLILLIRIVVTVIKSYKAFKERRLKQKVKPIEDRTRILELKSSQQKEREDEKASTATPIVSSRIEVMSRSDSENCIDFPNFRLDPKSGSHVRKFSNNILSENGSICENMVSPNNKTQEVLLMNGSHHFQQSFLESAHQAKRERKTRNRISSTATSRVGLAQDFALSSFARVGNELKENKEVDKQNIDISDV